MQASTSQLRGIGWKFLSRWLTTSSITAEPQQCIAAIAVGANIGDRLKNIREALQQLQSKGIQVLRHSRLYESAAAYVTDQPAFLNAALAVRTSLSPLDLLTALKEIEASAGRDFQGRRWGPRPLDLDIIFHGRTSLLSERLQLPHARWQERDFVIGPLADLYTAAELNRLDDPIAPYLGTAHELWEDSGGEAQLGGDNLQAVLPLRGERLWRWQGRTQVMGILNATPDSFSDGGQGPEAVLARARVLVGDGADVLDVGGQSTRPGASPVSVEEETARVVPIIRAIREDADAKLAGAVISVDTFQSAVAREAVEAGADIVNDVSGGLLDPSMHSTVAELGVSYVLMHMRGTPQTMADSSHTEYGPGRVAAEVGRELQGRVDAAVEAGIEPWRIITDPGIGFAKSHQGNLELIRDLAVARQQLAGTLQKQPMLAGPSRKGFLGRLTGRQVARDRDTASAVSAAFCIQGGANIIRMHDAAAGWDAARVSDGVLYDR